MKFFNLLKKELAELLNAQTIISLVVVMGLLMFMGSFMSDTVEEAVKQALDEKAKAEAAPLMNQVQDEYVEKAKKINEEESLFLKTAGDI